MRMLFKRMTSKVTIFSNFKKILKLNGEIIVATSHILNVLNSAKNISQTFHKITFKSSETNIIRHICMNGCVKLKEVKYRVVHPIG